MTRWSVVSVLVVAVALAAGTGCQGKIEPEKPGVKHRLRDVVVRVNGEKLVWADVDTRAHAYMQDERDRKIFIPKDREEDALQYYRRKAVGLFVNKTVMLAEAKQRGLKVTDADRAEILKQMEPLLKARKLDGIEAFFKSSPLGEKVTRREFEDGLFVDKLIAQQVRDKITITDQDRENLVMELYKARADARKTIEGLRAQLLKGADFAELARQHSDCPSRTAGGDLGEFPRGRFKNEKLFEDAAFHQKINEIGPVVETPYGYLIVKATARTPGKAGIGTTPPVPETVRASRILIKTPPPITGKDLDIILQRRKYEDGLKALLKNLCAKAKIETIYSDLVF